MKYSSIPSAQAVVQHCKSKGIRHIVISPGSRNAPLTIGFTEDSYFECYSIVDERCAAFFALGLAQQQKWAAALVCTSGSALLNYYPAVAEAFYSDIPLVIISADRPWYKIDIGDGQTIRQENVFGQHIGYSANLMLDLVHATKAIAAHAGLPILSEDALADKQAEIHRVNNSELEKAFLAALNNQSPVHINVPFEEPLYNKVSKESNADISEPIVKDKIFELESLDVFANHWNDAEKKMVLVGVNAPNEIPRKLLDAFAEDDSVLVFTETTSNIHHPAFFPGIDSIIAPLEHKEDNDAHFRALQPTILLTFGGMIVSKKIKAFLRNYPPLHHWHVDAKNANNTFYVLSHHFKMPIAAFLQKFQPLIQAAESDYYNKWAAYRNQYRQKRKEYLNTIDFSDLLAFHLVLENIPKNYQLQLANSSTVRYAQLFDLDKSVAVFSNRGTSGIDGSTATAIGASLHAREPTLLITGDLGFLYDSNALWNQYIRADFRIIVMNNGGGGIFRILPGQEDSQNFETYFETVHNLDLKKLCELHQIEHDLATDSKSLKNSISTFYEPSERPRLLEIKTPRLLNDKILLNYFDFLS